ncbi:MAG TPA: caspase family protein [Methylomirabilota bacterium]|nr:caspase family protein [Methylomirabilota bacterium]
MRTDGIYRLVRVEPDRYVFVAGPGRELHLTKDLTVAQARSGESVLEVTPPPVLSWPLEVGKKGSSRVFWRTPRNAAGTPARLDWSVEAYEDVTVIAGTFKAFRIAFVVEPGPADTRRRVEAWYAPEIRQFVKATAPDVGLLSFEVLAVDRAATAPLQIAIREPADQARFATDRTVVAARVTSGGGVGRVVVTVNGQEVSRHDETRTPKAEVALSVPVTLREGRNVLLLTATDVHGASHQEARTLVYERSAGRSGVEPTLQLVLASPPDQARVEQESIGLAGLVSGGRGVSRVVVTVNGVEEVSRQEEPGLPRSLALNQALKLREGRNTLVVTATDADGLLHQEVRTVHYEPRQPLTVAIHQPADRARLGERAGVVAAVVSSSKGVARVSVTLNGADVHQQTEPTPPRSLAVAVPVTLREGANAIVVSASEPDGTVRQEIRTVIYERPRAAAPAPPAPDRWGVVIGVGRYEHPDIPPLRYTVADAEAVYQTLVGPGGFPKDHVLLLTDGADRKPTLRNLKWALGTFLARAARKDDTVLIFFAGHGAPEIDPRGLEKDGLAKYLVPVDADPDDLFSTAFPMDDIQTIFGRIEAERVVVFLDTCYSGAAGGRTFAARKTRAGQLDDGFLERLARAKGRAIITAARPAEVSLELPELGHGLFTYYLVQGLRGAADLDRDGIVSLQELYAYLEQEVTRRSRAAGGNQHPVMKGELEGVLPLVRVPR